MFVFILPNRPKREADQRLAGLDEELDLVEKLVDSHRGEEPDETTTEDKASSSQPVLKGDASSDVEDRALRKKTKTTKNTSNSGRNQGGGSKQKKNMKRPDRNKGAKKKGGPKNINKRGQYNKNKFGNSYQTQQNNRKFKNVCLDPPDRYRTCYSRTVDPGNDLEDCDKITRNSYNLGAQLYKKERPIPESVPTPYTNPYLAQGESLTEGKMHLTIFQDSKVVSSEKRREFNLLFCQICLFCLWIS